MTNAQALAALAVIVQRADQTVVSPLGFKWIFVRAPELVAAQEALAVLGEQTNTPLVYEQREATLGT